MTTVFEQILTQVDRAGTPPAEGAEARMAQDAKLFADAGVREFLTAQMEAMRAAGFRARVHSNDIGVANQVLEWHPAALGEMPARATATFDISSTGDRTVRFTAHLSYVNDEGQETQLFLSATYLDRALLERWFATFVDLCLTARRSRGTV